MHTVCRISTFRSTEEMHSRKADWNRMQKTRSEKLGIWDNWERNLLKYDTDTCGFLMSSRLTELEEERSALEEKYERSRSNGPSYCSGLSRGFASSFSDVDLVCFRIFSISSLWALCRGNKNTSGSLELMLRWAGCK